VLFVVSVLVTGMVVMAMLVISMLVISMLVIAVIMLAVIVAMAARPVRMAVLELFRRRGTHVDDLDVEHERLAGERVVHI
jgi:hypothetical protein